MTKENNKEFLNELRSVQHRQESFYVASVFNNISNYHDYPLEVSHFDKKSIFLLYFGIAKNMIKKGYDTLDSLSVDSFISEIGGDIKKSYDEYGGYDKIQLIKDVVLEDNVETYYFNVLKYYSLASLYEKGFDIEGKWNIVKDMNYEEVHEYIISLTSDVFTNVELGKDKVIDIKTGLEQMVIDADKGVLRGIPYKSHLLTSMTHGFRRGEMTILGGKSGEGKSFLATNLVIPSMIDLKERIVIICNEEDEAKWQREIITMIINNKILIKDNEKFDKGRFFEGGFSEWEWDILRQGMELFDTLVEDEMIMFVNLTTFSMDKAIEIIKSYSSKHDIRYYILDTLKLDNDIGSKLGESPWLALQQSSVKLYNVVKKNARNSHIMLTYQLNKSNTKRLTMESIGISKNIVDVASTVILARNLWDDEKRSSKDGGLAVKNTDDKIVQLNKERDYMALFVLKNRAGSTQGEIIMRTDKAYNMIRDVGLANIADD